MSRVLLALGIVTFILWVSIMMLGAWAQAIGPTVIPWAMGVISRINIVYLIAGTWWCYALIPVYLYCMLMLFLRRLTYK